MLKLNEDTILSIIEEG